MTAPRARPPRALSALAALGLALALCALALSARGGEERLTRLRIVHTNDLHGHLENAAAIAAFFKAERKSSGAVLVLDAGDGITGTPVSTLYKGLPIFEVMSKMGYDAGSLGNHEFDHGYGALAGFRDAAAFPILTANAEGPDGKLLADAASQVFEVGGLKVGVLGLLTDRVPSMTVRSATKGCRFESPLDTAKRLVPELRKRCDVLVLLTHVGVEVDSAIAAAVPGVDVIVGGHTHTKLDRPLSVKGPDGFVAVAQAWKYGRVVGVLDLEFDRESHRVTKSEGRLVPMDDAALPRDKAVADLVASWERKVEERVGEVIGSAPKALDERALKYRIERIYRDTLGADLGYVNQTGVRSGMPRGDLTIRHVWTVLPFDNTLVRLSLPGRALPDFAKKALGASFDPAKTYVIAMDSFVAEKREKYLGTGEGEIEDTGLVARDAVVDWVREHGGL